MGLNIRAITQPRRIEYVRAHVEPEKYNPAETELIAEPHLGGCLWKHLEVDKISMPVLRKVVHGYHPITNENLITRRNAERTSYLSLIFHCPKSVSIMSEVAGDTRIRKAVYKVAQEIVAEQEPTASFRTRKAGSEKINGSSQTGNMAWIQRFENESRHADPHVHIHTEIMNFTKDFCNSSSRLMALNLYPFFSKQQALAHNFHQRLATAIAALGYEILMNSKGSFEICGVHPVLIQRFSTGRNKLVAYIERLERGGLSNATKKQYAEAEAEIRPKKKIFLQSDLRTHWTSRLTTREIVDLGLLRRRAMERSGALKSPVNFEPTSVADSFVHKAPPPKVENTTPSVLRPDAQESDWDLMNF